MDSSFYTEIVEDSEPERELERQARMLHAGETTDVEPVRITDPIVIEISSSDESQPGRFKRTVTNKLPSSHSNFPSRPEALLSTPEYLRRSPAVEVRVSDNESQNGAPSNEPQSGFDEEVPDPTLLGSSLARFAYGSNHNSRRNITSRTNSLLDVAPSFQTRTKSRSISTNHLGSQFSDAQLATVLACVCCELKWTTRKSAVQKLAHIRSCAKKRSFTDETVHTLISQVLAKAPPKEPEKVDARVEKAQPSKTYLEEVINNGAAKKKSKRAEPIETVQSVTTTRSDILCRARTLLDLEGTHDGNLIGTSTIVRRIARNDTAKLAETNARQIATLSDDELSEDVEDEKATHAFPATQSFAPSKFGVAGPTMTLFQLADQSDADINDGSDDDLSRPSTPDFAPSKLDALRGSSTRSCSGSPPLKAPKRPKPVSKPSSQLEILSRLDHAISKANDYALPRVEMQYYNMTSAAPAASPTPRKESIRDGSLMSTEDTIPRDLMNDYSPYKDDAYLHYDPVVPAALTTVDSHVRNTQLGSSVLSPHKLPLSPKASSPGKRSRKVANLTPRRKGQAQKDDGVYDDEWMRQLKTSIINNPTLHLRILRYEPIHFDEFVNLMTHKSTTSSRAALRAFLDQQAINFYGADTRKRR